MGFLNGADCLGCSRETREKKKKVLWGVKRRLRRLKGAGGLARWGLAGTAFPFRPDDVCGRGSLGRHPQGSERASSGKSQRGYGGLGQAVCTRHPEREEPSAVLYHSLWLPAGILQQKIGRADREVEHGMLAGTTGLPCM